MSSENAIPSGLQKYRRWWVLLPLLVLMLIAILLAFVLPDADARRGLKPFRPTNAPGEFAVEGQASVVTFTELNAEPANFRNQRLRVTGEYMALTPPTCRPYNGPLFEWALVAEELQLNATGFEALLRNIPANTTLTVEGVWRLYDGPMGCGKEPANGTTWYLAVERIISPNPLPGFRGTPWATAVPNAAGEAITTPSPNELPLLTPPSSTPTPTTPAGTTAPLSSPTPNRGSSPTPTLPLTPGSGTAFPSITPRATAVPGVSPTPSLPPGTTATPSPTTTTQTPAPTTQPLPTSPGYPVGTPGSTPGSTPTPTPNPY